MFDQADKSYACYLTLQLPYSDQVLEEILRKEFDVTAYLNQIMENDILNNKMRFDRTKNNPYLEENLICQILLKAIIQKENFQQVKGKIEKLANVTSDLINLDDDERQLQPSESLQNSQQRDLKIDENGKNSKPQLDGSHLAIVQKVSLKYYPIKESKKQFQLLNINHLRSYYCWLLYLFNKAGDNRSKQFKKIFSIFTNQSLRNCINSLSYSKKILLSQRLNRFRQKKSQIESNTKTVIQKMLIKKIIISQNRCHTTQINPYSTRSKKIKKFQCLDTFQLPKKPEVSSSDSEGQAEQQSSNRSHQSQIQNQSQQGKSQDNRSEFSFSKRQNQKATQMEQEYEIRKEQNKSHKKAFDQQTVYLNNQRIYNQKNILLFLLLQTNEINQVALSMIMNEDVEQLKQYVKFNLIQIENTGYLYGKYYKENRELIPMIKFSTKQKSQYVQLLLPLYFSIIEHKLNKSVINLQEGEVKLEWIQDQRPTNQYESEQINLN